MKPVLFIFLIITFVLTGCAHQPVSNSPERKPMDTSDSGTLNAESGNQEDGINGEDGDLDFLYEEAEEGVSDVADPLIPWNKAMFHFNDKLYFWVLKPVAIGYKTIMPTPARRGVQNFFHNLQTPPRFVNALLQAKGKGAWSEFSRFLVNSTMGVLGFWDPAEKHLQLHPCEEDLGQTLGFYGIGNGFYIVWPFLGSSTLRDTFGFLGDSFLDPVTYVEPSEAAMGARSLSMINATSLTLGDYESFKDDYYSPYEAFRNSYIQYRKNKVEK